MLNLRETPVNELREIVTEDGTVVDVVEAEYADQICSVAEHDLEMELMIREITSNGLQWMADEENRLENYEPTEGDLDYYYNKHYGFGVVG